MPVKMLSGQSEFVPEKSGKSPACFQRTALFDTALLAGDGDKASIEVAVIPPARFTVAGCRAQEYPNG